MNSHDRPTRKKRKILLTHYKKCDKIQFQMKIGAINRRDFTHRVVQVYHHTSKFLHKLPFARKQSVTKVEESITSWHWLFLRNKSKARWSPSVNAWHQEHLFILSEKILLQSIYYRKCHRPTLLIASLSWRAERGIDERNFSHFRSIKTWR